MPAQPLARGLRDGARAVDLRARRQERVAVHERPAEVRACWRARAAPRRAAPRARRSPRPARGCAVQDDVHRERQAELLHPARDARASARARRRPAMRVGAASGRSSWNETCTASSPRAREPREPRALERHAARDQVRVELAARAPPRRAPRGRRAASGSPPVRFSCTTPSASASRSTRRHVAVSSSRPRFASSTGFEQYSAAQRAAVGELRDQRVRARRRSAHGSIPRSRSRSRELLQERVHLVAPAASLGAVARRERRRRSRARRARRCTVRRSPLRSAFSASPLSG